MAVQPARLRVVGDEHSIAALLAYCDRARANGKQITARLEPEPEPDAPFARVVGPGPGPGRGDFLPDPARVAAILEHTVVGEARRREEARKRRPLGRYARNVFESLYGPGWEAKR